MNAVINKWIFMMIYLLIYSSIFSQTTSSIKVFPYYEDFENTGQFYSLKKHAFSSVQIYTVQTTYAYKGLIFKGSKQTDSWAESEAGASVEKVWDDNSENIASMFINVDASFVTNLFLKFDLKQTFKTNPDNNLFRVLVNGEQIKDIKGRDYISPGSNKPKFNRESFDLSRFAGDKIRVTLQSLCKSDEDCALLEYVTFDNAENVTLNDDND